MVEQRDPHTGLHSDAGRAGGGAPGSGAEPGGEGARPGVVGVREAGPGAGGVVRPCVRIHDGVAHRARAAAAGHRRRGAVRADPQGHRVRGSSARRSARRTRPTSSAWPTPPGGRSRRCRRAWAGSAWTWSIRAGPRVRVVADPHELPALPGQEPLSWNVGHAATRTNATQRPPRAPALVQRLGHVVLQSNRYVQTLDWYLQPPRPDRQRLPLLRAASASADR